MSDKLEPGCLAVIVKSTDGASVGKIVQCIKIVGEHSLYGTIWRVYSKDTLVTEFGGVGNQADCAATWLRKIRPDDLDKTITKNKEIANHE